MTSKEITQEFMLRCADATINKEIDKNKALTLEVEAVNAVDDYEIAIIDALDKRVIN